MTIKDLELNDKQRPPTVLWRWGLYALVFIALSILFASGDMIAGDDWETFFGASRRILAGEALYGQLVTHAYYSNPPWLAALFLPLSWMPFRWGLGILTTATFALGFLLLRRYAPAPLNLALFFLSPPAIYIFLHGQIDILILAGVLLPQVWWPLVALTKPQVSIGLALGVKRSLWLKAAIISAAVILASLALFGWWPLDLLAQPTPFRNANHNFWLGLWPYQVPVGIALILLGIERQDERFLFAASPFLGPYAAMSSFIGPWLAALSSLKNWQSALVFAAWWGAVIYRGLVGG